MTIHPEHRRSLPSMATRHTVHPEHKKTALRLFLLFILCIYKIRIRIK